VRTTFKGRGPGATVKSQDVSNCTESDLRLVLDAIRIVTDWTATIFQGNHQERKQ
jgi:hypothetical protein